VVVVGALVDVELFLPSSSGGWVLPVPNSSGPLPLLRDEPMLCLNAISLSYVISWSYASLLYLVSRLFAQL